MGGQDLGPVTHKENMISRFSIYGIRYLNSKIMEHKISPLHIYITLTRSDNEEVEEDYTSNEKTIRNQQ
jgi:hypothetical protein